VVARFERIDHRVMRLAVVLGGVLVDRAIAATDVAACETESRLDPRVSETQALFASGGCIRGMIGRRSKVLAGFPVGHRTSLRIA